jgi:GGDEF domain-containing protein
VDYADLIVSLTDNLIFQEKVDVSLNLAQREGWHGGLLYIVVEPLAPNESAEREAARTGLQEQLTARLLDTLRGADLLLQLEQGQFLVWLQNVNVEQALHIATRVKEHLQEPFAVLDSTVEYNVRIGIALYPFDGRSLEQLQQRAIYAVRQGRARGAAINIYDPIMIDAP